MSHTYGGASIEYASEKRRIELIALVVIVGAVGLISDKCLPGYLLLAGIGLSLAQTSGYARASDSPISE